MRFLVLGAGAVGGYFGGRLAEAKADVTFLVRPPRAALLRERGLAVESPIGDFRIPVQVATAETLAGAYDVVLLTAKAYDLDAAIAAIRPAVGAATAIVPLLNGLVHLERLDTAFGREHVLGGVAYVGATLTAEGGIRHHNRLNGITYGERDGGLSDRTKAIEQSFANTLVSAPASANIMLDMWEKFVMLTTLASMNCLMRGNVGEIAATEDGAALMTEMLGECQAIAAAAGYSPRPAHREQTRAMMTERSSINNASMHHDLAHGSRTEADTIVGDMLRRGRAAAIATPLLRTAWCNLQVYENRRAAQR